MNAQIPFFSVDVNTPLDSAIPDLRTTASQAMTNVAEQADAARTQFTGVADAATDQLANGQAQISHVIDSTAAQAFDQMAGLTEQTGLTNVLSQGQTSLQSGLASVQEQVTGLVGTADYLLHAQPSDSVALLSPLSGASDTLLGLLNASSIGTGLELQGGLAGAPAEQALGLLNSATGGAAAPVTGLAGTLLDAMDVFHVALGHEGSGGDVASLISSLSGDLAAGAAQVASGNFGANWADATAPLPDLLTGLLSGTTGSASVGDHQFSSADLLTPLNSLLGAYTGSDAPLQGEFHVQGAPFVAPVQALLDSAVSLNQQLPSITSFVNPSSASVLPHILGGLPGL